MDWIKAIFVAVITSVSAVVTVSTTQGFVLEELGDIKVDIRSVKDEQKSHGLSVMELSTKLAALEHRVEDIEDDLDDLQRSGNRL